MTKYMNLMILVLILTTIGFTQSSVGEMEFPEGNVQHVVNAEDIQWKPCPAHLPSGCEVFRDAHNS